MRGHITISAGEDIGITITAFMELNPSKDYSEQRTVKDLVEHLLDYKPEAYEMKAKEEEANE